MMWEGRLINMGLFSKSKKVNEYEEASNNLNNEATTLASERVIFEQIQDDDERAAFLVDQMKLGSPLIINFEKLPIMGVNKLLAFLQVLVMLLMVIL